MTSGTHLSRDDKYRIYVHCILRGHTASWLHDNLFLGEEDTCSLEYLRRRVRFFQRNFGRKKHDRIIAYILGRRRSGGPKPRLCAADDLLIEAIIKQNDGLTDKQIARLFGLHRAGDGELVGTTLVRRARLRRNMVMQVYDRSHIAASRAAQKLHYQICASVHEDSFINLDEVGLLGLVSYAATFPLPTSPLPSFTSVSTTRTPRPTRARTRRAEGAARANEESGCRRRRLQFAGAALAS